MKAIAAAMIWLAMITTSQAFQTGKASYYTHGHRTANGERYNPNGATCAHRTIAFGTMIRVTNLRNGRTTICRVNDRGPFVRGRIVDLSRAGANDIGMNGLANVTIEIIGAGRQSNCMILPRGSNRWRTCRQLGRGM